MTGEATFPRLRPWQVPPGGVLRQRRSAIADWCWRRNRHHVWHVARLLRPVDRSQHSTGGQREHGRAKDPSRLAITHWTHESGRGRSYWAAHVEVAVLGAPVPVCGHQTIVRWPAPARSPRRDAGTPAQTPSARNAPVSGRTHRTRATKSRARRIALGACSAPVTGGVLFALPRTRLPRPRLTFDGRGGAEQQRRRTQGRRVAPLWEALELHGHTAPKSTAGQHKRTGWCSAGLG